MAIYTDYLTVSYFLSPSKVWPKAPLFPSLKQKIPILLFDVIPEDLMTTRSSENIHRLIRASSRPFSGAFTTLEGVGRLTIWRAEEFEHPDKFFAVPGQILFNHEEDPIIACGTGALRLTDIFLDGVENSLPSNAKKEVGRRVRSRFNKLLNYASQK